MTQIEKYIKAICRYQKTLDKLVAIRESYKGLHDGDWLLSAMMEIDQAIGSFQLLIDVNIQDMEEHIKSR